MSMSNRDKKLGPPPRWVNCPRKGHLVQGKHLIDTHVLLVGVHINTGIQVYCGTWIKNIVSRYIFSILVYRLNWWSSEFCYGLGITKFWFELNGWCICYCPKHEKKVGDMDTFQFQFINETQKCFILLFCTDL